MRTVAIGSNLLLLFPTHRPLSLPHPLINPPAYGSRASTGLLPFVAQFLLLTYEYIANAPLLRQLDPPRPSYKVAHLAPKMSTRKRKQEAEEEEELLELPDESEEEEE